MRRIILPLFLVLGLLMAAGAPEVWAQQRGPGDTVAEAERRAAAAAAADDGQVAPQAEDPAAMGETSRPAALLFWLVALTLLGGAVFVITRSNLVTAVMGMVGSFFAIAVVYVMLYAHFLAAIQVLVYAGAIMVLFVFVIMILNRPEAEPYGITGAAGKVVAGLAIAYLLWRLGGVLWDVTPKDPTANLAPGQVVDGEDFGSTANLGRTLFTQYLFPFEAVSIILLIAVVGAIAVARPGKAQPETSLPDESAPDTGRAEA